MRTIKRLYIHHSESPLATTISDITRWHVQDNKWNAIGYHYVLHSDGTLKQGRSVEQVGAHVLGDNTESIGLCVVGDFDYYAPTKEQLESLNWFIPQLCHEFNIKAKDVLGHRDGPQPANNKTCPGRFLYNLLPDIRKMVR